MEEKDMQNVEQNEVLTETVQPPLASPADEQCEAPIATEETVLPEVSAEEVSAEEGYSVAVLENNKKPKKAKKKLWIFAIAGVVCAAAVFLVVYFLVIKPNGIYKDAEAALQAGNYRECKRLIDQIPDHEGVEALRMEIVYADAQAALQAGNYQECERLLNKIPDFEKVPALRTEMDIAVAKVYIEEGELNLAESMLVKITGNETAKELKNEIQYLRAAESVNKGDFDEATLMMEKIPEHEDPQQLREQIKYGKALAALELGDYETAYANFSELGDYEDAAKQKDTVYYEALAFVSLFDIQPTLKNPASLRVKKVTFYQDSSTEGELDAVYEITATNSYGGAIGGYVYGLTLYDGNPDTGMISISDYVDPEGYDILYVYIIDGVRAQTVLETTVDIARMNRLLEGNASFKVDLPFQSGAVVES